MKKMSFGALSVLSACAAFAAPVAEEVDGRWQLTVPEGETYTLTADDVAAIGDRPFQKAGGGTLIAGDEMGTFHGDVYVVDGIYKNASKLAFGASTAPVGTIHVDGGTIWNTQAGGSDNASNVSFAQTLELRGDGYRGLGALSNTVYNANLGHNIRLAGDTRVAGSATVNFRYDTVNLGGYRLTTDFAPGNGLMLVATSVVNPGDVDVRRGFFGFESNTGAVGSPAQTVTYAAGTSMRLSVLLTHHDQCFVFTGNGRIENVGWDKMMMDPVTGKHGGKDTGFFRGPVELGGRITVGGNAGMGVSFMGGLSGAGGFDVRDGLWLRLGGAANAFAGGVSVVGRPGVDALSPTGGLALAANGALPVDGAPLQMKDATLGLYAPTPFALPALAFDGAVVVTGDVERTTSAASLVKTGDGDLTVFGPLAVAGATDIRGGTLRFATRVPDFLPGLYWAHNTATGYDGTSDYTPEQIQAFAAYEGVDRTGVGYAYKGWVNTVATTNAADGRVDWHNNHWYAGYVNIPGEPGADVNCRFISGIARFSKIVIDGVVVHQVDDGKVIVPADFVDPGSNLGWTRHAWGHVVPLKAGWHRIYCYMGSHYQTGGATACSQEKYGFWPANFGFGVNFNASEDDDRNALTNKANYVKLLDPGDGSFLRTSTNADYRATLDAAAFRPAFGGPVAFASGTALDIGDVAPYVPVAFPSLAGVPTIRNGRVEVGSSVWTLRAADVTGGAPLSLESTAELAFPAGDVTVDLSEDELAALETSRRQAPFTVMQAAGGASLPDNAFKPSDRVKAARWRLVREDGKLVLASSSGLAVMIR